LRQIHEGQAIIEGYIAFGNPTSGGLMGRTEAQFRRDEAKRLMELAAQSAEAKIRQHLLVMANEWLERAKVKDGASKKAAS
jgi:hypothetical protein